MYFLFAGNIGDLCKIVSTNPKTWGNLLKVLKVEYNVVGYVYQANVHLKYYIFYYELKTPNRKSKLVG